MDPPSKFNMAAYFKMAAVRSKIFSSITQTTVDLMLEAQKSTYLNDLVYLARFCFGLSLKYKMAAIFKMAALKRSKYSLLRIDLNISILLMYSVIWYLSQFSPF